MMQRDREPTGLVPASASSQAPALGGVSRDGVIDSADQVRHEPLLLDDGAPRSQLPIPAPQMEITAPEADAERVALALMRSGRTEEAVSFLEHEIARTRDRAWKAGKLDVMRDITPEAEEIVVAPIAASAPVPPVESVLRPRRSALDASLNIRPSREADEAEDDGDLHAPFDPLRSAPPRRRGRLMLMSLLLGVGVAGAAVFVVAPKGAGLAVATDPAATDAPVVLSASADLADSGAAADAVKPVAPRTAEAAPASAETPSTDVEPAVRIVEVPATAPAATASASQAATAEAPASGLAALADGSGASGQAPVTEPRLPRVRPAVVPDIQTASLQPRPLGTISEIPAPAGPRVAAPGDVPWSYDGQQAAIVPPYSPPAYGAPPVLPPVYGADAYGSPDYGAPSVYQRALTPEEQEELTMRRRLAENYAAERRREGVVADNSDDDIVVFDNYSPPEQRRLPLGPIRRLWGD